jgi:hypothetical protein
LLFWEQGQLLRDWVWARDRDGAETKYTVDPDAFFALQVSGLGKAAYFLELDRGTMPIIATGKRSDLSKKILGYWHYRRTGAYTKKYAYNRGPDGSISGLRIIDRSSVERRSIRDSHDQVKGFNVLIVTPGSVARDGSTSGRIKNVLEALPRIGQGITTSSLFWLSSLDKLRLEQPGSIFASVWVTSKASSNDLQSLIK